jgi:hypothetical protein
MDLIQFREEHQVWKHGKGIVAKDEQPATWLMSESGWYTKLVGDLQFELGRLSDMGMPCTVHRNATAGSMRIKQAEITRKRNE